MKVICLALENSKMLALSGALDIFSTTNEVLNERGLPSLFNVEVVSVNNKQKDVENVISAICNKSINDVKETADLILIPGLNGDILTAVKNAEVAIPFLREQYSKGCELASLCTGSFVLASTKLLQKNDSLTTHWQASELFEQTFPDINLKIESVITDSNGIYSSGGATSSFNLLIYLIEKFHSKELALYISKIYALDYSRMSQLHFSIFSPLKKHDDKEILKAQQFIEENIKEKFTIDDILHSVALSKRNFIRRFKKATNSTPKNYIQNVKIEVAKRLLENGGKNITEIMYESGYNDGKSFRTIFKRITGITPQEYKNKYQKLEIA